MPCYVRRIGEHDSILIILGCWLELILAGKKTLEIRGKMCRKQVGKTIWLCASGTGLVMGKARVTDAYPLSERKWEATRHLHLVPGKRLYGAKTHAWAFEDVQHVAPVAIVRKRGSIDLQTGPGSA